jgi:hypothetical protein
MFSGVVLNICPETMGVYIGRLPSYLYVRDGNA